MLADERDLRKFIRSHYGVAGDTLDALANDDEAGADLLADPASGELDAGEEASVIKLVNDLLLEAIRERATDIHIEPYEDELTIRYRIDGVLSEAGVPADGEPVPERDREPPQDHGGPEHRREAEAAGRTDLASAQGAGVRPPRLGHPDGLRRGRRAPRSGQQRRPHGRLEDLGMPSAMLERWDTVIARPHGILLVTGPTGSGKSTTLYASLNRIVSDAVKAITVEDPVEYQVDGVNQIQVNNATRA